MRLRVSPPLARFHLARGGSSCQEQSLKVCSHSMGNRVGFAAGEWYHCYNRGVDKRRTFNLAADYERFLALLYVCNGDRSVQLSDYSKNDLKTVLSNEKINRGEPLVEIATYCLMPNHIHLVLRQVQERGIPLFMQKVFTAYTMYFNRRHNRTGPLFAGVFKSKHVHNDAYLKKVVPYVLLNPAELVAPRWKDGIGSVARIKKEIYRYPYSNAQEFFGTPRIHDKIIGQSIKEYYEQTPTLRELLSAAQAYYQEYRPFV